MEQQNEMTRRERAVEHKRENNCCQAVLLAYQAELGMTREQLLALGACFGSGMGGMEETCGALCGAQMVQGMLMFDGQRMNPQSRQLRDDFEARCGATRCRDLKGVGRGTGALCSCEDCVRHAVGALERALTLSR